MLITGYRPGALARYGLDAATLATELPALAVVEIDAWGDHGPWGRDRGFDSIVQAATGLADIYAGSSPDAVSYTHLDVYKRQALNPAKWIAASSLSAAKSAAVAARSSSEKWCTGTERPASSSSRGTTAGEALEKSSTTTTS